MPNSGQIAFFLTPDHQRLRQRLILGGICGFMATGNTDGYLLRAFPMKKQIIAIAILCCLPLGCAAISDQAKKEEYGRTMDSYETAMRLSDFNAACKYIDPAEISRKDCLKRFDNLKVVSYNVLEVKVAEGEAQVTQTVEVEYYFLDRYIVEKIEYEQSWRYKKAVESWLLETGPPDFE
jgi:hypothetical protein